MTLKNPADRPLTRQQAHELAAEFIATLRDGGARMPEGQWERHERNIKAIIDREPKPEPMPAIPPPREISNEEWVERQLQRQAEMAEGREIVRALTGR